MEEDDLVIHEWELQKLKAFVTVSLEKHLCLSDYWKIVQE